MQMQDSAFYALYSRSDGIFREIGLYKEHVSADSSRCYCVLYQFAISFNININIYAIYSYKIVTRMGLNVHRTKIIIRNENNTMVM